MPKIRGSFLLFLSFTISQVFAQINLKEGDVILMSFNCYECRMIESETNSPFSHSGVVIRNPKTKELMVAQSLGEVALYSLKDFLKNKTPNTKASIYRPIKLKSNASALMYSNFVKNFQGLKFDEEYLWNNRGADGRELVYCSEFIAKFLDEFLDEKTKPQPLSFGLNYSYWRQYFKGRIPEGELGNNPASFSRDHRFKFVQFLDEH